jgi:hypothetical protein
LKEGGRWMGLMVVKWEGTRGLGMMVAMSIEVSMRSAVCIWCHFPLPAITRTFTRVLFVFRWSGVTGLWI